MAQLNVTEDNPGTLAMHLSAGHSAVKLWKATIEVKQAIDADGNVMDAPGATEQISDILEGSWAYCETCDFEVY